MKRIWIVSILFTVWSLGASEAEETNKIPNWSFFAFDNGVGRDQGWTPDQQATLLADLGYDGIGYTGLENLEARFAAMEALGLNVFSIYEWISLEDAEPIPAERLSQLKHLEGTGTILWLTVTGKSSEKDAVNRFRKVADIAAEYGVKVAIYPHDNTYVATGEHALNIARAVDHTNFGVSINVCHELKAGNEDSLIQLIHSTAKRLFIVSISGADRLTEPHQEKNWDRLIQPLGQGNFNMVPFLSKLRECGYEGPVGLQCYQIRGDIHDVLKTSKKGWGNLLTSLPDESE
jgi:sugar phosphate isomerase/epimerase